MTVSDEKTAGLVVEVLLDDDGFGNRLAPLMASAGRLGIELDEAAANRWIEALEEASDQVDEVVHDADAGVFGHRVAMLDFSADDLAHFRNVGRVVEFDDVPGRIETALALSGSAAQSKVQSYPGDCDFFERVNIIADTRDEACSVLAEIMREKILATLTGETYQFLEAKFGSFQKTVLRGGHSLAAGSPISWNAAEVKAGYIVIEDEDGEPRLISWDDAKADPGWCKLDWVIADPERHQLANASNMLDVTWEAPDGAITPLDGYLDGYFQEIYLDAESVPIFSKLVKQVSPDALDHYVGQLEKEVSKYAGAADGANYGKAAKRMYNIFRLTGRYQEAAFLRELFDEPAALLYQVWSLMRTVDEAAGPGSLIGIDQVIAQTDDLIMNVIRVLENDAELEIVRHLLKLEHSLLIQHHQGDRRDQVETARAEVLNIVNNFFYSRMTALPEIKSYMQGVEAAACAHQ